MTGGGAVLLPPRANSLAGGVAGAEPAPTRVHRTGHRMPRHFPGLLSKKPPDPAD